MLRKNRRRYSRIAHARPVRIAWEDEDDQWFAIARSVDISEQGMRVEVAQPVSRGVRIMIAAQHLNFSGSASVRHVTRIGCRYFLGVELTQPIGGSTILSLGERSGELQASSDRIRSL